MHETTKEWVARMTTLVECWNKLDGNVGELSSWVATKDSAAPDGQQEISIEKLEGQLNQLKIMFAEKQKLVADLDAYGPVDGAHPEEHHEEHHEGGEPAPDAAAAPAEAPADGAPPAETPAPAEEAPAS